MPTFKETDDFIVDLRGRGEQRNKQTNDEGFRNPVGFRKPDSQGSWLHFIQYNNAFLIILVACVLAFGSLSFASEEVRDATIGGKTVYAEGTDNTLLLEQDFDKFNMDFKITGIVEDEESYAVQYSYVDFDLTSPLPVPPLIRGGSEGGVEVGEGAVADIDSAVEVELPSPASAGEGSGERASKATPTVESPAPAFITYPGYSAEEVSESPGRIDPFSVLTFAGTCPSMPTIL